MKNCDPEPRLNTATNGSIGMVFFELQTGIIKRNDWKSNFYHFRLRNGHKNKYTINWLRDVIVNHATVGNNGLEYPTKFLQELNDAEESANKTICQFLHLCPDRQADVPQKLN